MSPPRLHRDPQEVQLKRARLTLPHIATLTQYVEALRASKPDALIPFFDPAEAGTGARILLLLEAPGKRAAPPHGSGFVSPDNNDQTAQNMWLLLQDAGVDRSRDVVTWNVVPWYIGDGRKIRAAKSDDLHEGREAVQRLLDLLPDLRVVVLLGRKAQASWKRLKIKPRVATIECPHPSPLVINTTPGARELILSALVEARSLYHPPSS
ncbi:MAG TPA: uracil-DNA glycosylase [Actinomycetota bacterium]|nr:uracil-DNA glycosylase [Actinomycetota bacterium]